MPAGQRRLVDEGLMNGFKLAEGKHLFVNEKVSFW